MEVTPTDLLLAWALDVDAGAVAQGSGGTELPQGDREGVADAHLDAAHGLRAAAQGELPPAAAEHAG